MIKLKNGFLEVQILDPETNQDLLGARYVRGGQVFQVLDGQGVALLAGPTYPDAYNSFDSQGLPDAFNSYPNLREAQVGDDVMVLGVGHVKYERETDFFAYENQQVSKALEWKKVHDFDNQIVWQSADSLGAYAYTIERAISLCGSTLSVRSKIKNCGLRPLPISWFAHPFLAHNEGLHLGEIPLRFAQKNHIYKVLGSDVSIVNPLDQDFAKVADLTFQEAFSTESPFAMKLRLKNYGHLRVACDFAVAKVPLWYNQKTFSPEPYIISELDSEAELAWEIHYIFEQS